MADKKGRKRTSAEIYEDILEYFSMSSEEIDAYEKSKKSRITSVFDIIDTIKEVYGVNDDKIKDCLGESYNFLDHDLDKDRHWTEIGNWENLLLYAKMHRKTIECDVNMNLETSEVQYAFDDSLDFKYIDKDEFFGLVMKFVEQLKLSQMTMAEILNLSQPKMSRMKNNSTRPFNIYEQCDILMRMEKFLSLRLSHGEHVHELYNEVYRHIYRCDSYIAMDSISELEYWDSRKECCHKLLSDLQHNQKTMMYKYINAFFPSLEVSCEYGNKYLNFMENYKKLNKDKQNRLIDVMKKYSSVSFSDCAFAEMSDFNNVYKMKLHNSLVVDLTGIDLDLCDPPCIDLITEQDEMNVEIPIKDKNLDNELFNIIYEFDIKRFNSNGLSCKHIKRWKEEYDIQIFNFDIIEHIREKFSYSHNDWYVCLLYENIFRNKDENTIDKILSIMESKTKKQKSKNEAEKE